MVPEGHIQARFIFIEIIEFYAHHSAHAKAKVRQCNNSDSRCRETPARRLSAPGRNALHGARRGRRNVPAAHEGLEIARERAATCLRRSAFRSLAGILLTLRARALLKNGIRAERLELQRLLAQDRDILAASLTLRLLG